MDRSVNPSEGVELADSAWGDEIVRGEFAGHEGLLYEPSPGSIASMLDGTERWAGRDYLVQGDRRITHGAFRLAIGQAAKLLEDAGVRPGSRVVLHSYNRPEFILATWAIWWLGAVPVYANRWWSPQEFDQAVATIDAVLVLSDDPQRQGGHIALSDLAQAWESGKTFEPPRSIHALDDPALILFTSGSSGAPKAVVLPARSVIVNQHNLLARSRRLPQNLDSSQPQSVTLVCTPLFHIGGVSNILTNLIIGGRLVLTVGKFDAGEILDLIDAERVQSWGGVPTMATRVLEHPSFDDHDLSSLRSFPLGGAPLPASLLERMTAKLPQLKARGLANTWGMTESGGFVTVAGNADLEKRPGTVGRPYRVVELKIDQPDDRGSGEILVRSPTVMLGYLGRDDGTVDSQGWLRTGDLGHLDSDGYLFLDGRSKDIVIRGGENIACAHVEQGLLSHPSVIEAAVFGVPDDDLGEQLVAAVTYRAGEPVSADDLVTHCRAHLAYFEVPAAWRIGVHPLPTLAGEKLDKKRIRSEFIASAGGA